MMSSSDRRRAAGKSAVAVEPEISTTAVTETRHKAGDGSEAASAEVGTLAPRSSDSGSSAPDRPETGGLDAGSSEQGDPWFGVTPRSVLEQGPLAGGNGSSDAPAGQRAWAAEADPDTTRVEWFLPGGRAALLPDSMTTLAEGDEAESGRSRQQLASAAGAPPWAADSAGSAAGTPPPWENGPWSGPGGDWPSDPAAPSQDRLSPLAGRQDEPGPWTPRTVLVTGLLPLVVPGLVVGVLGLLRSRPGEPGRRASVLALAASLVWAVVIVVLAVASTGGSSAACSYPASVHQAYAKATADLSDNAPAATKSTDLGSAASRANSAAAAAGDIGVRTALFALAGDLQLARADVIAGRPVLPSLRKQLGADAAALTASCPS